MDLPAAKKTKNPRTGRLLALTGAAQNIRLLEADRAFLRDLARVQLISGPLADAHHYAHLKGGSAASLARLERAGLITSKRIYVPGQPPRRTYQFADRAVARAWGGDLPVIGAKRTDYHELITSELYFRLGRPADFRLASHMSKEDVFRCGGVRPDAVFPDPETGELVLVEADSGQYTQRQIADKMRLWRSVGLTRQVWGQPRRAASPVPSDDGVQVFKF